MIAKPRDIALRCSCGAVRGVLADMRKGHSTRVNCWCKDCRAALEFSGAQGCVSDAGAVELFITLPGRIRFTDGKDQLCALRLSPRGLMRWYARCCGMPMGNVLANRMLRFASLPVAVLPDPRDHEILGKLAASLNRDAAPKSARPPRRDFGAGRVFYSMAVRHLASLTGRGLDGTPYFDAEGRPVGHVKTLNAEERRALNARVI